MSSAERSRKIEKATQESIPFRFVAGGLHPDHSTIAEFRETFLAEIMELFVQVLVIAHEAGVLNLGNISLDGSKVHADASKSKAVSYGRLQELQQHLRAEVEELMALGEKADQTELPAGINVVEEILLRQGRLTHSEMAKAILEARAKDRYAAEQAEYEASASLSRAAKLPVCVYAQAGANGKRRHRTRKARGANHGGLPRSRPRLGHATRINLDFGQNGFCTLTTCRICGIVGSCQHKMPLPN